jgi:hypothetical protein
VDRVLGAAQRHWAPSVAVQAVATGCMGRNWQDWRRSLFEKRSLLKVLNDGLGWQREATRAVRLVSRSWKEVHDSSCVTVQVPRDVTDERLQLVCTRFPALTCLNLSCRANVTDVGTFMR